MRLSKVAGLFFGLMLNALASHAQTVETWLTNADRSVLFQKQKQVRRFKPGSNQYQVISVNADTTYQNIDGFGFALTGGSAQAIIKMNPPARAALLKGLFAVGGNNIGISYLRVSIGASDLNDHVFSYDDLPAGETDTALSKFDLGPDKADVISVLKQILAINPKIKILGSPWSAPVWMKTKGDTRAGSLQPQYYKAYAAYFIKYIKSMRAYGITMDAITIQMNPCIPVLKLGAISTGKLIAITHH